MKKAFEVILLSNLTFSVVPLSCLIKNNLYSKESDKSHAKVNETVSFNYINNNTSYDPFFHDISDNFDWSNGGILYGKNCNRNCSGNSYSNEKKINWSKYSSSWDEFKKYYGRVTFKISGYVKATDAPTKNLNQKIISLSDIENSSWHSDEYLRSTNIHLLAYTADGRDQAGVYLDWYKDSSDIHLRIYGRLNSVNYAENYVKYEGYRIEAQKGYDDNVQSNLQQAFNNTREISLNSDWSTSVQDERNRSNIDNAISNVYQNALGSSEYNKWKKYFASSTYSDSNNEVTSAILFKDPITRNTIRWEFKTKINFHLTQEYWNRSFKERLTITPGKIIDPNNPNGEMIIDSPLRWNNQDIYGTTAFIRFDAAPDGSETMKVNGVAIQVINNQFTYNMSDNQEHQTNKYDILLEKHDLKDFNKILGKYEVHYSVKQIVPTLNLKWYAWDPDNNPDQKLLVTPNLDNGKANPYYDKEVNPDTGTKTQILWVKSKAEQPFPLDPLKKTGEIIKDNKYEEGFLAEASVSGMGIKQLFSDDWIKKIERVKIDPKTLKPIGNKETIRTDKDGQYYSWEGTYLYLVTDQKGITANKIISIGQKYQEKYAKFLDILNEPSVAVDFWTTIHGFHLKNYLVVHKNFDSNDIQTLSFEQVSSYWKEYVSNVKSQFIGPDKTVLELLDLSKVRLDTIKMNLSTIDQIKTEIISNVSKQLAKYNLEYNVDFEIKDLDQHVQSLLYDDINHNKKTNLTVTALWTSMKVENSAMLTVRNDKDYDEKKVFDLSRLKFQIFEFNFSNKTVDELIIWVRKAIENQLALYKINLTENVDYVISHFDDQTLRNFISSKIKTELKLEIVATDNTNLAKNSAEIRLINNPSGVVSPPEPPKPPIPPDLIDNNGDDNVNNNDNEKSNKKFLRKNMWWIVTLSVLTVSISIILLSIILIRKRKGIGNSKIKRKVKK